MSNELRTKDNGLKAFLEKHIGSVQAVAAATLNPERMTRLVCAAASRDEKLAECSPLSILRSLAQAASMGLEPFDGRNEVYLVPRWNSKAKCKEATCLVGYAGLIRLATDTGKVRNIDARVVYAKDEFAVEYGVEPRIIHKPTFDKDRGDIVAVYAVAHFPDGGSQFEVMSVHEVNDIRDRSKDKKDYSPWTTDYSEMARKTAVRRLAKYLPKSQALGAALENQAKAEAGDYFDGEVIRPGDANPPELGSSNAEGFWVWSEEDIANFFTACDVLMEQCQRAGLSDDETDKKIAFYAAQKESGEDSPEKVLGRMSAAGEALKPKRGNA